MLHALVYSLCMLADLLLLLCTTHRMRASTRGCGLPPSMSEAHAVGVGGLVPIREGNHFMTNRITGACDVMEQMVGGDTAPMMAYLCTIFIRLVTTRAWHFTHAEGRYICPTVSPTAW